mmetsp:Transcript_83156/g.134837  ORF Transcript_83156/g.134837 Transcript_83156/m.134837 type:complete len:200 (-) Transcript_83156:1748-2347(-)
MLRVIILGKGREGTLPQTIYLCLENRDVLTLLPRLLQHQPPPHHLLHLVLPVIRALLFAPPHAHDFFALRNRDGQVLHVFGEFVVLELFFADVLVGSEEARFHVLHFEFVQVLTVLHLLFQGVDLLLFSVVSTALDHTLQILGDPQKLHILDIFRDFKCLKIKHLIVPCDTMDLIAENFCFCHHVDLFGAEAFNQTVKV